VRKKETLSQPQKYLLYPQQDLRECQNQENKFKNPEFGREGVPRQPFLGIFPRLKSGNPGRRPVAKVKKQEPSISETSKFSRKKPDFFKTSGILPSCTEQGNQTRRELSFRNRCSRPKRFSNREKSAIPAPETPKNPLTEPTTGGEYRKNSLPMRVLRGNFTKLTPSWQKGGILNFP
jgi:hypothetical protein